MPKYIIMWDAGYGEDYEEVEAENEEAADTLAYERWQEAAEHTAVYGIIGEATDELREEYGL